jgi:hypothetical protein
MLAAQIVDSVVGNRWHRGSDAADAADLLETLLDAGSQHHCSITCVRIAEISSDMRAPAGSAFQTSSGP